MDISQVLPKKKGYAEFGYVRPVWESNSIHKMPHTKSSHTAMWHFSDDSTAWSGEDIDGGQDWHEVVHIERLHADPGTTTVQSSSDIILNQLGNTLFASSAGIHDEMVGIDRQYNPEGCQEFEVTKSYIRVKKVTIWLQASAHGATTDMDFMAVPYRSDMDFTSAIALSHGNLNNMATPIERIPGAISWSTNISNLNSSSVIQPKHGYKKLEFNIPEYFNDVEWHNDAPKAGSNFWVAKDSNNLFTALPNLQLKMRLYARVGSNDDGHTRNECQIKAVTKWDVEYHTGTTVSPSPARNNR